MGTRKRKITLQAVADAAGVSSATVDRVLNRRLSVREDTALRVIAAAEALGYHAAHLMRQILVDHARSRRAAKRGGHAERVPLDGAEIPAGTAGMDVVALDEALSRLAQFDERKARMIELKYFGGMTEAEVAEAMGTSERTLRRELRLAKAWLSNALA